MIGYKGALYDRIGCTVAGTGALAAASLPILSRFESCFKTGGLFSRTKCATSFPAVITSASSFNQTLMAALGSAVGVEARAFSNMGKTGLTFWTPNVIGPVKIIMVME